MPGHNRNDGEQGAAQRMRHLERLEAIATDEDEHPRGALRMLDEVVVERRVKPRDCRDCKNFDRDDSGLNFGWCSAHDQWVKLYHPAGEWFSQCIFKGLRRFKPQELERTRTLAVSPDGSLIQDDGLEVSLAEDLR